MDRPSPRQVTAALSPERSRGRPVALSGFLGLARSRVTGTTRGSGCCGVGGVVALAPPGAAKPGDRSLVSGEAGAAPGPAGRAKAGGRPWARVAVGGAGASGSWSRASCVWAKQCARLRWRSHLCDKSARGNPFVGASRHGAVSLICWVLLIL